METSYYNKSVLYNDCMYSCNTRETLLNNYLGDQLKQKSKTRDRKETFSVTLPKVEYLSETHQIKLRNSQPNPPINSSKEPNLKGNLTIPKDRISIKKIDFSKLRSKSKSHLDSCTESYHKETSDSNKLKVKLQSERSRYKQHLRDKSTGATLNSSQRSNSCSKIPINFFSKFLNDTKGNLINTRFSIVSGLDAGKHIITSKADNSSSTLRIPLQNMHIGKLSSIKLQSYIKAVPISSDRSMKNLIKDLGYGDTVPLISSHSHSIIPRHLKKT